MATRKRRITAQDVATEARVSRTTVSFVLNNTPGKSIPEATRQRVLEAAAKLGYIPNENAQRLARTRDHHIGLFICHSRYVHSDVYLIRALEGMSRAANRSRVRLSVHPVTLRETSYLDLADKDGVDGLIVMNSHEADPALQELVRSGLPAVTMDYLGDMMIDQVYVDNVVAARKVTRHLTDLGHRRIAMITHAPPVYFASRKRMDGYREALTEAGVEINPRLVRHADFTEQSGYEQMTRLLQDEPEITAVFAGNDVVAYGVMQAILESGRTIPDDLSLVGFDDDYMSRFLSPALTTMAMPATGHGSASLETLLARIYGEAAEDPVHRLLQAHLNIRDSTSPPSR